MGWKPIEFAPDEIANLGTAEAIYRWAVSVLLFRCFFALVSCFVALLFFWRVIELTTEDFPGQAIRIVVLSALGVAFLVAGVFGLRNNYLRRKIRIMVFPDALVILEDEKFISIPWKEIVDFSEQSIQYEWHGAPIGTDHVYKIHLGHGEQITIKGDLEKVADLGPIIRQRTAKPRM